MPKAWQLPLTLTSISGPIYAESVIADILTVKNVSGAVIIGELNGRVIAIETGSGDIKILKSDVETVNLKTTSGGILLDIKEQKGNIDMMSVSGAIDIKSEALNCSLSINSTSGDIQLYGDQVEFRNLSQPLGNGHYNTVLETVSGSIYVKR